MNNERFNNGQASGISQAETMKCIESDQRKRMEMQK